MQQVNGKWGAYDESGTAFHKCFDKKETETKKLLTLEDLDLRLGYDKPVFGNGNTSQAIMDILSTLK